MSKIDFYQLDGQILKTFLTILEVSSVTLAAERLGVTQSAVSHTLSKLRAILGDPLFVRSGQGIAPTETALSMKGPVQDVLDLMRALTDERVFDPKSEELSFVVAANDMQRDLIFPELARNARRDGISLSLELKPSGVPSVALLRDGRCDLILTPLPPDAGDLFQQSLFTGDMKCFYDPAVTTPPKTLAEYMAAEHISVRFALGGTAHRLLKSPDLTEFPNANIKVSNFSGIAPFVKGTRLLATEMEFKRFTSLSDLAMAPLPFATEPATIFMVWHERANNDPAHKWLRNQVKEIGTGLGFRT